MKDSPSRQLHFALRTLILICLLCCAVSAQEIQIKGSDTLIYLGQRVRNFYQKETGTVSLQVLGGGLSETSSPDEIVQWEGEPSKGLSTGRVTFPVGVQAIVLYVNPSNAVKELTISQVRKIFLGEITNWKDLGGPDSTILLYAGESSTDTLPYFQEAVLRGEEPYPFVGKANTKDLLNEIAQHPGAIGYGSLDSNPDVRPVAIKSGSASLPIEPTRDNIRSRVYPITRRIYWAVSNKPDSPTLALCHWILSSNGQLVIESVGFEPLLPPDRATGLSKLTASATPKTVPVSLVR